MVELLNKVYSWIPNNSVSEGDCKLMSLIYVLRFINGSCSLNELWLKVRSGVGLLHFFDVVNALYILGQIDIDGGQIKRIKNAS